MGASLDPRRTLGSTRRASTRIRRLSWAGVSIETETHTLLVDPWATAETFPGPLLGEPVPIAPPTARRYAAITHLHGDHYDRSALQRLFAPDDVRGAVIAVRSMATDVASAGLPTRSTDMWEPQVIGPFTVTPVPGVDGFGGEQVSWIIDAGDLRVFHGGDGLWHGRLSEYGRAYGPFDYAFLCINGVRSPGEVPPALSPRTLGPGDAVDAAAHLGARVLVPIHYGIFSEGFYEETPDCLGAVMREAERRSLEVLPAEEGQWVVR